MQPTRRSFLLASAAALGHVPTGQAGARGIKWMPKLSENLADVNPETLRWLKQLGCQHVIRRRVGCLRFRPLRFHVLDLRL